MSSSTITLYDTREMTQAVNYMKRPFSFILDTFFTETNESLAETIEFDIVRNKRRLAPFVHPMAPGKVIARDGFTTRTFKPAYVKPKLPSSCADFLNRLPGETIYSLKSVQERASAMMVKDLAEMDEYILRREEWMAVKALTTGQIPVVGDGVNYIIDLLFRDSHTLANTELTANGWATANTAKPLDDLDAMSKIIAQDAGQNGNLVVMGETAWKYFINSEQIQNELSKLNSSIGTVTREPLRSGAIYRGLVGGYQIWSYLEWYVDPADDTEKELWPTKGVLLGSTAAKCVRHYGAIRDLKAPGGVPVRAFAKSWEEEDPSTRYVMVQSAPIPAVEEVDAFVYADVAA